MIADRVADIARALSSARVPFLVAGGLAVVAHGYVRGPDETDPELWVRPDSIHAALDTLAALGYRPANARAPRDLNAALIAENHATAITLQSDRYPGLRVAISSAGAFAFQSEYDSALVEDVVPGIPIRLVRLDTLIHLKQHSGRFKDLADIAELRRLHPAPAATTPPDDSPWTFDGVRLRQMRAAAALPFSEKLRCLDDLADVAERLRRPTSR